MSEKTHGSGESPGTHGLSPEEGGHGSHAGRPGSWLAVAIMVAGFVVGGVGLCIGPSWVMFWAGAAIIAIGFVVGGVVHIFADVVVDAPRVIPEIVDYSVFGSRTAKRRGGQAGETIDKPIHTDTQRTPHG
ncbi:hypothetical protein GCM10010191_40260 [Actinomadura vinacea]|uniref:Uncharacterized protein n=1 Tax=Actinomadura vinacea TaxID=115336 RepID=A0ABN3JA73_9ACTN